MTEQCPCYHPFVFCFATYASNTRFQRIKLILEIIWLQVLRDILSFLLSQAKKKTRTIHCVREIRYTNKNIRLYLISSNDTVSVSLSSEGTHII